MEDKCYLAIETRPKNYFPINLLDLSISPGYHITKMNELDAFTLKYTKQEIIDAIKEANLLDIDDNMPLVLIYNEKNMVRKASVLTKDISFNLWQDIQNNFNDKKYLNKIINFLNNKVSDEVIIKLKSSKDLNSFCRVISSIPYLVERKLYFYLYENQL
jgi:hypothetical protein